jgi:hypothetical protein
MFWLLSSETGSSVSFVDVSVLVLSGTISIANTAQFTGGLNLPCPVPDAEVCAINCNGEGEEVFCATSDALGMDALTQLD